MNETRFGSVQVRAVDDRGGAGPAASTQQAIPRHPVTYPTTTRHTSRRGAGCEPGYTPCLPIVDDLNCDDINDSLKPIDVTGDDPYHLDADRNGLGCES